jgi:hypothetical protein
VKHDLPSGSRISATTDGADTLIAIPHPGAGPMRFVLGLFLLFWLGMWAWGWRMAFSALAAKGGADGASVFLLFWLAAWTVAGVAVMYALYRALRPPVPESLRLTSNGVVYDSGVPPPSYNSGYFENPSRAWRSMHPKRTRVEIDRRQLQSLRLRETNEGNRLTVDADAMRIEIGKSASEIEREWLYHALVKRYSLRPPIAGTAGA